MINNMLVKIYFLFLIIRFNLLLYKTLSFNNLFSPLGQLLNIAFSNFAVSVPYK
jgi:hypothetical protein